LKHNPNKRGDSLFELYDDHDTSNLDGEHPNGMWRVRL